jgi:hypothetical protein
MMNFLLVDRWVFSHAADRPTLEKRHIALEAYIDHKTSQIASALQCDIA